MGGDARIAFSGAEPDLTLRLRARRRAADRLHEPGRAQRARGRRARVPHRRPRRCRQREPAQPTSAGSVIPEQMTLGDGAWSWFADPRAVHHQGVPPPHVRRLGGTRRRREGLGLRPRHADEDDGGHRAAGRGRRPREPGDPGPARRPRARVLLARTRGATMWYRTTLAPEDISAWGPAVTMPENSAGTRGFTYPNPIRLAAERRTYLFWRGGNYNPTFATQADGQSSWSPVRRLISAPGRPYVKYDTDGDAHDPLRLHQRAPRRVGRRQHLLRGVSRRCAAAGGRHADRHARRRRSRRAQADVVFDEAATTPGSTTSRTTPRDGR